VGWPSAAGGNLFLRKQPALYQERGQNARGPDPAKRVALVLVSWLLDRRSLLTIVTADTLSR
jgi:hypothetical protein